MANKEPSLPPELSDCEIVIGDGNYQIMHRPTKLFIRCVIPISPNGENIELPASLKNELWETLKKVIEFRENIREPNEHKAYKRVIEENKTP